LCQSGTRLVAVATIEQIGFQFCSATESSPTRAFLRVQLDKKRLHNIKLQQTMFVLKNRAHFLLKIKRLPTKVCEPSPQSG
jgi:hypothetical protein